MLYIIIFLSMLFVCFCGFSNRKNNSFIFIVFGIGITLLSMFRFGSGMDYFNYFNHYLFNPSTIKGAISYQSHIDVGFRIIMGAFKYFNLSYETFIAGISLMIMFMYLKAINKNSNFKIMSLLIFFSVYYSIYVNSSLRQGVALVIFFTAYYKYLKEGQTLKYVILILIAMTFHSSAVVTLIIPFIKLVYKKAFNNNVLNISLLLFSLLLCFLNTNQLFLTIGRFLGMSTMYEASKYNPFAIALRVISLGLIYALYKNTPSEDVTEFDKFQIYTYFIGSIMFISVSNIQILSRILEYFTILEIILIPNFIKNMKPNLTKFLGFSFTILLIGVIFAKDIYAYVDKGQYYNKSILGYKYISVFNKYQLYDYKVVNMYISDME